VTTPDDPHRAVRDAITVLEQAHTAATDAINAATDPQQAFTAATEWSSRLRKMHDQVAELRATCAARVWTAEQMSLAELAQRIGVSKARADQLVRDAKKQQGGKP
jgi:hypothetical protein